MDLYFNASFGLAESCKLSRQNSDPCHSKHTYIYIYIYIQAGVVKYSVSEIFGDAGRSIHEYSRVSCFALKHH